MTPPPASEFNSEGHWYTSYPSLNHWGRFGHEDYSQALRGFLSSRKPLHLYVHIPFCAKLCYYCICNIVVTNEREKIELFLSHMLREIDNLKDYPVEIHDMQFGGGTPSHLDQDQFGRLCEKINTLTPLKSMDEVAMEIDPRTVKQEDLRFYASQGVTRISFGVQDFDPRVQEAINRVQPPEMIEALLTPDIRKLFRGVNFDLLYGLPFQTRETVRQTVERVRQFRPDRITLLKYCHVPEVRKHMKLISQCDLPSADQLPVMFCDIAGELIEAGYQWIGLDHFALPTDNLSIAQVNSTVKRTFNGFTPGSRDMIGVGPTTTSCLGNHYAQSFYDLHDYYNAVNKGEFPVQRGYSLSYDDCLRREVIFELLCSQKCDFRQFGNYFNAELTQLEAYPDLCHIRNGVLYVSEQGRLLLRTICRVFDRKDLKPEHKKISQFPITRKARLVA